MFTSTQLMHPQSMLNLFILFRACAYDLFSVHIFQHPYFSLQRHKQLLWMWRHMKYKTCHYIVVFTYREKEVTKEAGAASGGRWRARPFWLLHTVVCRTGTHSSGRHILTLNLNLKFYLAYIQHNTIDTVTEHMSIMNAMTPVITKIVDATGRTLKLQNTIYL